MTQLNRTKKTIVVMPAYNAESTLAKTIADIPFTHIDEIVLVDDASKDKTVEMAHTIGAQHLRLTLSEDEAKKNPEKILLTVAALPKNGGYGFNQKNCYRIALERGAEIVVMLHPDYQYDPKLIRHMVEFIDDGYFDVMLGSRIRSRQEALAGGMPPYKYYANRILTFIQNIASGRALSEWHTGMRAYTKDVLRAIEFDTFSNDFVFDTQVLFSIIERGYTIGDIPVPVRYFKEASSINFSRSCRYGLLTLWETAKFLLRNSREFAVYVVVGILGVVTNLSVYGLLLYQAHLWYVTAASIGFLAGAITSFTLQKYWTFRHRSHEGIRSEIPLYLLILAINGLANNLILYLLINELHAGRFIGGATSNGIVALWSFFIYKYLVFRKGMPKQNDINSCPKLKIEFNK